MQFIARPTLYGQDGAILQTLTRHEAQRLVDLGHGKPLGSKRRWHCVVLSNPVDPKQIKLKAGKLPKLPPESHKRETRTNPPGVWELRRIAKMDRQVFIRPMLDCLASAASVKSPHGRSRAATAPGSHHPVRGGRAERGVHAGLRPTSDRFTQRGAGVS